jgi:hypothetical protein
MEKQRQAMASASERVLRLLSGETDLGTEDQWRQWYDATRPGAVAHRRLLEVVLEEPDVLTSCSTLLRRIVPRTPGQSHLRLNVFSRVQ